MPRGDNSGPQGLGAVTGRGLGNCTTTNANSVGYGQGRGRAPGRGLNRVNGRNNFAYATPSLEEEQKQLKSRLDLINKQLQK